MEKTFNHRECKEHKTQVLKERTQINTQMGWPYLTPSLSLPEDRAGESDNYASRCKLRVSSKMSHPSPSIPPSR